MKQEIALKRAYEPAEPTDGFRVYIDRLWPRGLSHATFPYDVWDKDLAPSNELREWFHADPDRRWREFRQRYGDELKTSTAFAALKAQIAAKPKVTLLFSSRNAEENNAVVVRDLLISS